MKECGEVQSPEAASGLLIIASWLSGPAKAHKCGQGYDFPLFTGWHLRLYKRRATALPLQEDAAVAETLSAPKGI